MDTGTWGLYYNYTWWGNAIQTAPSVIGKPDFFGSQFEMLTSQQPNQVVNGDFSNGSTGWTFTNGTVTDKYNASMTAYQSGIKITPFSYTGTFKVVFDLVITSGNCKFDAGSGNDEIYTTSGIKEKIITNPTKFEFNAFNLGWVGSLDNVSVQIVRADNVEAVKCLADWIHETQILDV